jgi:hypothetical protein
VVPSTVVHITLSLVKLCLPLSEVDCFYALWNGLLINHLMYFMLSEVVGILLKINFHTFYALQGIL